MGRTARIQTAEFPILGITTRFETDDPALIDAVVAAYSASLGAAPGEISEQIRIRLSVVPGSMAGGSPGINVAGSTLQLVGQGVRGEADAVLREAHCGVPPDLVMDPDRLVSEVLDPLVLFLLTRTGRVPLHAAGVLIGDTAVLLAGPSGAGKSTLALAARRAGLRVLSDDTVYLQLRPVLRVWGLPRPIHVVAETELVAGESGGVPRLRAGRWKIPLPIDTSIERECPHGTVADKAILCLLERGSSAAITRLNATAAVDIIMESLEPGFDHFREQLPAAVARITSHGAWRLVLSSDPAEGLAVLRAATS